MRNYTGVAGQDSWWIGQVAINQLGDKYYKDGWDRVRVRILRIHSKSGTQNPDSKLQLAMVERPTTQGSFNRGSTGLSGGEWVRGYFMDEYEQVPVIAAVLTRSVTNDLADLSSVKSKQSTEFKNVTAFNAGFGAPSHRVVGGPKPSAPAKPTKEEFSQAKESISAESQSDSNDPNSDVPTSVRVSGDAQYVMIGDDGKTEYQRDLERLGATPEEAAQQAAEQRESVLGQ